MLQRAVSSSGGGGSSECVMLAYNNSSVTAYANTDYVTVTGATTFTFKKAVQGFLFNVGTASNMSGTVVTKGNLSTVVSDRDSMSMRVFSFSASVGDTLTVGGSYPSTYTLVGVEQ